MGSRTFLANAGLVGVALLFVACGGGSGGTSQPSAVTPTTLAGTVVDGYIEGANVCLDVNGNQACDAGEPSAVTAADGSYKLDTTALTAAQIAKAHIIVNVPTTAKDTDDNGQTLAQAGKAAFTLMAPASKPNVVSPLTTLISHELIKDAGKSLDDAQTTVRARLGLKATDDLLQDIGKIKSTDTNVNVKNVAVAVALSLGEIRKAIDSGNTVSGKTDTTEQQKTLATLQALQEQITALLTKIDTSSSALPKVSSIQTALKTKTDELKTSAGASAAIAGTVQVTAPATSLLGGANLYSGSLCASSTNTSECTPQMYVTTIAATGAVSETDYDLTNNAWVTAKPYTYTALNTKTNAWVSVSGGAGGNFVADASGTAGTYTASLSAEQTRILMRQADISGKDISTITGMGPIPTSLKGLVFPAGSLQYLGQFTPLTDRYRLWSNYDANCPTGTGKVCIPTGALIDYNNNTTQPTYFTTLSEFMSTYATGNTNGKCWHGFYYSAANPCYLFDAGGTATGGTISVYGSYSSGSSERPFLGKGTYEIRTFGSIKVLVITQAPASVGYSAAKGGLSIFTEKNGYAIGGTLYPAGVINLEDNNQPTFNKIAFAAIVSKLSGPALP